MPSDLAVITTFSVLQTSGNPLKFIPKNARAGGGELWNYLASRYYKEEKKTKQKEGKVQKA